MRYKVIIRSLSLAGLLLYMAGCEKDQDFLAVAKTGATSATGFGLNNISPIILTVDASTTEVDTTIKVFNSSKSGTDTKCTIVVDTAVVNNYNTVNSKEYDYMPVAAVTVPASITIPANSLEGDGKLAISITKLLTYGSSFALGLTITTVSGGPGQLLTFNSHLAVIVQVKNKWDGTYFVHGYFSHPTLGGPFTYDDMAVSTSGPNSVDMEAQPYSAGLLGAYPRLTVDPATNKVTVTSWDPGLVFSGPADPAYNNHYDPAKKIFYINYGYTTSAPREAWDTLEYTGPR